MTKKEFLDANFDDGEVGTIIYDNTMGYMIPCKFDSWGETHIRIFSPNEQKIYIRQTDFI